MTESHAKHLAGGAPLAVHRERHLPDWPGLWDNAPEIDLVVSDIEGNVPKALVGTLYKNGPGRRDLAATFFDGDGMIRALRFEPNGSIRYRSRFVQTPKYLAEMAKRAPRVRAAGTQRPGGMLFNIGRMPKTDSNTHVVPFRDRLLSLHEGGAPFLIDPLSLATLGEEHFDGALPRGTPLSAHPHADPITGESFNFGLTLNKRMKPVIRTFKLDRAGNLSRVASVPLRAMTFMHDFALSQRFMVFIEAPMKFHMAPFLLGTKSAFECFEYRPEQGSRLLLLSRDGQERHEFELDPLINAHTVAAREEGESIVLDFVESPDWNSLEVALREFRTSALEVFARTRLRRLRVNLNTRRVSKETVYDWCCDFPRLDPRRPEHEARFAYLTAAAPSAPGLWTNILKVDLVSGETARFDFGPGCVVQEPVFVPNKTDAREDAGYLISYVHDGARQRSNVVILDALAPQDGPVATLRLPFHAGMTYHGTWVT